MPMEIDNELSSVIDLTAMILVSMKNDPTPPSSPISSSPSTPTTMRSGSPCLPLKTEQCDCMLCTRTAPPILSKCHTWAWIMRVVFYSLRDRYPEKKFFSLKNDVYEYMMNHWNTLGLDRKRMLSVPSLFFPLFSHTPFVMLFTLFTTSTTLCLVFVINCLWLILCLFYSISKLAQADPGHVITFP